MKIKPNHISMSILMSREYSKASENGAYTRSLAKYGNKIDLSGSLTKIGGANKHRTKEMSSTQTTHASSSAISVALGLYF